MKNLHKKIIGVFLPIPFLFAIIFCCCLERDASADESVSHFDTEHQHHHSQGDHECTCPKHLSFLSVQSADIVFDSTVSQMLAKNFMVNLRLDNIVFIASLSNHSQGPPLQDHLDHVSLPIYLKISNLRI